MNDKKIKLEYICPNSFYKCDHEKFSKIFELEAHYKQCPYTIILKNFSLEQL